MRLRDADAFKLRGEFGKSFRWILARTKPFGRRLLLVLFLDALLTAISVGVTVVNKRLIDGATRAGALDAGGFVLLAALTAASIAVGTLTSYLAVIIREQYTFGMREGIFSRVLRSRWLAVSAFHSEDLTTRLTGDLEAVSGGIADLLPDVAYMLFRFCFSFGVLYYYEPPLALAILTFAPAGALAAVLFGYRLRRYQRELMENESSYRAHMQESSANLAVIKAFEQEKRLEGKLKALREARLAVLRKRNRVGVWLRLSTNGVFSLGYLLAFFWGIYRLSGGDITYGTMSVFLSLVSQVQSSILALPNLIPTAANVLASAGRVMEIDAIGQETAEGAERLTGPVGVRFDGVSFAYGQEEVLREVSLNVPPGARIGLVGESGAGKTTMVRVLLGLASAQEGSAYLYDALGKRQAVGASGRRYLAYVAQGNTLLSGTIRENLRMGKDDATEEEMGRALRAAEAGFVYDLPDGLDTRLTERGGVVSEGQAQRIAIARAILRERPVLILDEATSALDMATERAIIQNLKHATSQVTCVVISHRASLLDLCDQCYLVKDGRVTEETPGDRLGSGQDVCEPAAAL